MLSSRAFALALAAALLALAGCGSGSSGGGAAKSAGSEAAAQATGDIPDNQVFLTYADKAAHYAVKYPEGWARSGSGASVGFSDKDNTVRVTVARGSAPAPAAVRATLSAEAGVKAAAPRTVTTKAGRAILVSYQMQGPADPVTGKRPLLLVDRYVYARAGRVATMDLATPKGVDNVDAYRLISRSFQWR
ncbi:MAG: hypothetical protein QOE28_3048 [Solirubrobacteraceae bacterium]|jgi:hypothetical protein|nr:hypothetical protein [Solirubrobacteraceae bacterium]